MTPRAPLPNEPQPSRRNICWPNSRHQQLDEGRDTYKHYCNADAYGNQSNECCQDEREPTPEAAALVTPAFHKVQPCLAKMPPCLAEARYQQKGSLDDRENKRTEAKRTEAKNTQDQAKQEMHTTDVLTLNPGLLLALYKIRCGVNQLPPEKSNRCNGPQCNDNEAEDTRNKPKYSKQEKRQDGVKWNAQEEDEKRRHGLPCGPNGRQGPHHCERGIEDDWQHYHSSNISCEETRRAHIRQLAYDPVCAPKPLHHPATLP
mmetsp:Transcript_115357/g.229972  ORF Transcript_115357/g.229972 Transcript_115357/m.229972 type:complete len:260 (+) Transcript_115357:1102-1881(+)